MEEQKEHKVGKSSDNRALGRQEGFKGEKMNIFKGWGKRGIWKYYSPLVFLISDFPDLEYTEIKFLIFPDCVGTILSN